MDSLRERTIDELVKVVTSIIMTTRRKGLNADEWQDVAQDVWTRVLPHVSKLCSPEGKYYHDADATIRKIVISAVNEWWRKKFKQKRLKAELKSRVREEPQDQSLNRILHADERSVSLKKVSEILQQEFPKAYPVFVFVCVEEVSPKVAIKRLKEKGIACCSLGTFRKVVSKLNGRLKED